MSTPSDDYKTWQRACPFCFADLHGDSSCKCPHALAEVAARRAEKKEMMRLIKTSERAVRVIAAAESAAAAGTSTPLMPAIVAESVYSITKECRLPEDKEMAAAVKGVSWRDIEALAHTWMAKTTEDVDAMLVEIKSQLDALTSEDMRLPNRNRVILYFASTENPIYDEEGQQLWNYRLIVARSVKKIKAFVPKPKRVGVVGSVEWATARV